MIIGHHCMTGSGSAFLEKHGFRVEWNRHLECDVVGSSRKIMNHVITLLQSFQGVSEVGVGLNTDAAFAKEDVARGPPGSFVFMKERNIWIHVIGVIINENPSGRFRDRKKRLWRRLKLTTSEGDSCAPGCEDYWISNFGESVSMNLRRLYHLHSS